MNGIAPEPITGLVSRVKTNFTAKKRRAVAHEDAVLKLRPWKEMTRHVFFLEREVERLRAIVLDREAAMEMVHQINNFQDDIVELLCEYRKMSARLLGLTEAETRVYSLIREERALSQKEISKRLGISVGTVKFHVHSIFVKAGVRRSNEL